MVPNKVRMRSFATHLSHWVYPRVTPAAPQRTVYDAQIPVSRGVGSLVLELRGMHLNDIAVRIEKLSAQYADIYGIDRSAEWALLKLTEEVGELAQAHLTATGQSKGRGLDAAKQRQNLAEELGDVLGMCLVYAQQQGIDPEAAVAEKWFRHE